MTDDRRRYGPPLPAEVHVWPDERAAQILQAYRRDQLLARLRREIGTEDRDSDRLNKHELALCLVRVLS